MPTWRLLLVPIFLAGSFSTRGQDLPTAASEITNEFAEEEAALDEAFAEDDKDNTSEHSHTDTPLTKRYNRRVLLMVFINESKDKNTEYLGVSVADAFSTPLIRTGNFIILNRNSVDHYIKTMNIPHEGVYDAENATRLGKAIGADVIVVGKFVTSGESVLIEAKAIDVQAGLVSVADTEQIKTNSSMFSSINRLAERMSGPMAERMKPLEAPPPPAEVVLDEKQVADEVKKIEIKKTQPAPVPIEIFATEHRLYLEPGISLLLAPGVSGKQMNYDGRYAFGALNPGLTGMLTFQSSLPQWKFLNAFRWFDYVVSLEYARYSSAYEVMSSTGQTLLDSETMRLQVFGAAFSVAHDFAVWKFALTPYAGASIDYANFVASDGTALFQGVIPGANMGCRWRIYQWQAFEAGLNLRLGYRYLNDGNSYFNQTILVSGGYRL